MRDKIKRNLFAFAVLIAFRILYYQIRSPNKKYSTIPRKDTYIVDKNVDSFWHYEYVRNYHKVICRCPNFYGDSLVYYDDKLVSYTSSSWSNTHFLNDEILSIMTTGNYFRTEIQGTEIFVSYLFRY